jgi:hypothetical protein
MQFSILMMKQVMTIINICYSPSSLCKTNQNCHNPSLGFTTKARAYKSAGQKGSPGVTFHALGSTKECEGMNPHTPKGTLILGSWSPNGLPNFQRAIARVKTHWIKAFLISLKSSWNVGVWNGLAWPIWTSETQVMLKRRAKSQIGSLTPDH